MGLKIRKQVYRIGFVFEEQDHATVFAKYLDVLGGSNGHHPVPLPF